MLDVVEVEILKKNRHLLSGNITIYHTVTYSMFLNVTIQYMQIRFANGIKRSSAEFKVEIHIILNEINAYIPRFITRSDKQSSQENHFIIGAAFTIEYD